MVHCYGTQTQKTPLGGYAHCDRRILDFIYSSALWIGKRGSSCISDHYCKIWDYVWYLLCSVNSWNLALTFNHLEITCSPYKLHRHFLPFFRHRIGYTWVAAYHFKTCLYSTPYPVSACDRGIPFTYSYDRNQVKGSHGKTPGRHSLCSTQYSKAF